MHEDADSQKREKALRAGDTILDTASNADADRRAATLHFLYGGLLSRREIEAFGAKPAELRDAVQYARGTWQLTAAVSVLLCLVGSVFHFFEGRSLVWMFAPLCAGILWLRWLMRRFVLEYLEKEPGEEFPG